MHGYQSASLFDCIVCRAYKTYRSYRGQIGEICWGIVSLMTPAWNVVHGQSKS